MFFGLRNVLWIFTEFKASLRSLTSLRKKVGKEGRADDGAVVVVEVGGEVAAMMGRLDDVEPMTSLSSSLSLSLPLSAVWSVDEEEGNEEGEKEGVGKGDGELEVRGFDSLSVCALLILVWSSSFSWASPR